MKIYIKHARACGYCARGVREFFRRHGLDFDEFLREGIESEVLLSTKDEMAYAAVEQAEKDGPQ